MKSKHLLLAGLITTLVLAVWSAPLAGQQGEPQVRLRLRERISDLYLLRLTRALDLTEEQTAKIYPLLNKAEKLKASLQRQMGLDLRDLRAELAETRPGDEAVAGLADRIRQARRAIRQKDEEVEALLDSVLTPVQRARYLVFTVDFLRSVGENVNRARAARGLTKRTP